jgi:hypothetical protein
MATAGRAAVSVGVVSSVGVTGACAVAAGAVSKGAALVGTLGETLASGRASTGTVTADVTVVVAIGGTVPGLFSSLSPLQAVSANKTKNTIPPTRVENLFFLFPEFSVDNLFFSI